MSLISCFFAMVIAFTFVYAGIKKYKVFDEFQSTLEMTFKVPTSISKFVAISVISFELSLLPIFIFGPNDLLIYQIICFMMFIFFCIPLYAVLTKKTIQCNCFGQSSALGWEDLLRNMMLLIASVFLCISPPLPMFYLSIIIIILLALCLVVLMINLKSISAFIRPE